MQQLRITDDYVDMRWREQLMHHKENQLSVSSATKQLYHTYFKIPHQIQLDWLNLANQLRWVRLEYLIRYHHLNLHVSLNMHAVLHRYARVQDAMTSGLHDVLSSSVHAQLRTPRVDLVYW